MIEKEALLTDLKACLQEEGIEATEEEMHAAIAILPVEEAGELSEENLEDVAGGRILPLPIPLPFPSVMFCPRCRKFYNRRKGHKCRGGKTGRPYIVF